MVRQVCPERRSSFENLRPVLSPVRSFDRSTGSRLRTNGVEGMNDVEGLTIVF